MSTDTTAIETPTLAPDGESAIQAAGRLAICGYAEEGEFDSVSGMVYFNGGFMAPGPLVAALKVIGLSSLVDEFRERQPEVFAAAADEGVTTD